MPPIRIAVIDDEAIACKRIKGALEKEGYEVETFIDGASALDRMKSNPFHVVITDIRLPGLSGMEVLIETQKAYPHVPVIMITGYGSIDSAVEAMKKGAYHYVTKPVKLDEIRMLVKGSVERIKLTEENTRLRQELEDKYVSQGMIGSSNGIRRVFVTIKKLALVDCNVLIQGDSGTGKELVARAIHYSGQRKNNPFVSFNCGGFTEELVADELFGHEKGAFTGASATRIGLLETANGGTVFLDEIGEMPLSMQIKLLRVIEERSIFRVGGSKPVSLNIRIIGATNRDLKEAAALGLFRDDLFHRLNVVAISLPRLVDRKDDIPPLVNFFLDRYNSAFKKKVRGITPSALNLLLHYDFPGNVRELENIIERAVALSDGLYIDVNDLPGSVAQGIEGKGLEGDTLISLEEKEREYVKVVLSATKGNKIKAADILGVPRTTLWRKIKKYNLTDE
ncbi:MAG: sigma-54 dependent transcriptional regulator [Pseudomonadota bacterium]